MRISDWSSDVCSSDLLLALRSRPGSWGSAQRAQGGFEVFVIVIAAAEHPLADVAEAAVQQAPVVEHQRHAGPQRNGEPVGALHDARMQILRSEEHTSELQSLMRISYAVFCLKKKINTQSEQITTYI